MSEHVTSASSFAGLAPIMREMEMGTRITPTPYFDRLEQAIRDQFPGVDCGTFTKLNLFSAIPSTQIKTSWWKAGTDYEELSEYKARQVRAFCAGWVQGHRACDEGITASGTPAAASPEMPSGHP